MKHVYKVPFLFRRISTPPESDLYEIAAGRVMNIMSLNLMKLKSFKILVSVIKMNTLCR